MTEIAFDTPGAAKSAPRTSRHGTIDDPGYVAGVSYDRYGRYLLPRPGEDPADLRPWTRVTTLAGTLTSNEGLRVWTERHIARGIGMRSDLRALLAADPDSKTVQDEVLAAAKEVAGVKASASWGRAVHRAIESMTDPLVPDADRFIPDLSEQLGRDVLAAVRCLHENGIKIRAAELVVVHEVLEYAGRLDALWEITLPDGQRKILRIGDVKTGNKPGGSAKRQVAGAQLAAYANATHVYDPTTRSYSELPTELDRSAGYVLGVRDNVAKLYEIDLTAGWQDVLLAVKLHRRRSASTDMMPVGRPIRVTEPAASTPAPTSEGVAALVEEAPRCPGDPSHLLSAHDPGGSWYGVPTNHERPVEAVAVQPDKEVSEPESEPALTVSGRKRRACSICRQPGHTAKKCPTVRGAQPAVPSEGNGSSLPPASSIEDLIEQGRVCQDLGHRAQGWKVWPGSARPDVVVCGVCGLPSQAVLDRLAGERTGTIEGRGAVEAESSPTEPGDALTALTNATGTPPWEDSIAEQASDPIMERLDQIHTRAELGQLWTEVANGPDPSSWTDAHTARARELSPLLG